MLSGKRILAVVPARSGSKGIPNKNMTLLGGVSLIGLAGIALSQLSFIDAKIISTDSPEYKREGVRYGLDAPFLRPAKLSRDDSGAIETIQHALLESEKYYSVKFDIILIIEPTSPLRTSKDIEQAIYRLLETGADSVVTVSPVPSKFHPLKILKADDGKLKFYLDDGQYIKGRQQLTKEFYWRNGVCYALTRACLMEHQAIFTNNTIPEITSRDVVNIDDPVEVELARLFCKN